MCGILASLPDANHNALLPLAALGLLTWVAFRAPFTIRQRLGIAYGEAAVAAVAVLSTGAAESPVLPYLLAPGLTLGLRAGPRAVLQATAVTTATFAAGILIRPQLVDDRSDFITAAGQWVLLGLAVGIVASWARRLMVASVVPMDRYAEARQLLGQLRTVTRGLPGGLDAGSAAQTLLEEAARLCPNQKAAVLVQTVDNGALIPIAVRGTRRVPWRAPLTSPGPLRQAWETSSPVVDRRRPDKHGRREGSAVAAVPLIGSSGPFGLLVMESRNTSAFEVDELTAVADVAGASAVQLETALLFDEVRNVASAEERNRLAREMHDGVAQELAFIGYRLDAMRPRAQKADPTLADEVGALRKDMTDLISNLRLSITDLKTSVSHDRGLGEALSSYVRAAAAGRGLRVHLSLQESPLRLAPDREVALFRLAQLITLDVREAGRADNLWVTLTVDPPSARLQVEHDGPVEGGTHDLDAVAAVLTKLGGSLEVRSRRGGGARVEAVFEGGDDEHQGAAG